MLGGSANSLHGWGFHKKKDYRKQACGRWVLLYLSDEFEEVGFVERQSGVFGIK
jgi:hypothetical protein